MKTGLINKKHHFQRQLLLDYAVGSPVIARIGNVLALIAYLFVKDPLTLKQWAMIHIWILLFLILNRYPIPPFLKAINNLFAGSFLASFLISGIFFFPAIFYKNVNSVFIVISSAILSAFFNNFSSNRTRKKRSIITATENTNFQPYLPEKKTGCSDISKNPSVYFIPSPSKNQAI